MAAAERLIGLSMPIVAGSPAVTMGETLTGRHIWTLEGSTFRDSTPARSTLSLSGTRPVSLNTKESTRAIFERLAQTAGLNIIFDPDFRSIENRSFKFDNLNVLDALDVLALQTRTFWEPVDSKTIIVAPDNQGKRRDLENVSVKTFYLPNVTKVEMVEILTSLRALLNARYVASVAESNAIVMRDTVTKLALAEKIIADARKSGGFTATGFPSGTEGGYIQNHRAAQTAGVASQTFSFDTSDTTRATYEAVTARAGLRVIFDTRFQDAPATVFKVEQIGIADALDYLALQTRTIWQMMDRETVLVAPDTQTVRADLLPKITKTISTRGNINDIVTALRTILGLRQVSTIDNSIVIADTAENIAFSEKLVRDLEGPATR
jgi:hypothetical protein